MTGVGLGGELSVIAVLAHELAPPGRKARAAVPLHAFGVGLVLGAALAFATASVLR